MVGIVWIIGIVYKFVRYGMFNIIIYILITITERT